MDQLNVVLESSKTSDLGLTASMGSKLFTSSRIELVNVSGIAVDAIKINGKNNVATQSATAAQIPSNTVRVGFRFIPAGQEGVGTTGVYRVYYNGNPIFDQSATTVPDDIGLAISMGTNTKGTTTTNLMVDYVKVVTERVV